MQSSITSSLNTLNRIEVKKKKNKVKTQSSYAKVAGIFRNLNPNNWFADFSNLSITLEEFTPKKNKPEGK